MVDAAYWMKGCGSHGRLRFAVLIELDGKRRKRGYALVDLKEGLQPAAPMTMDRLSGRRPGAGSRRAAAWREPRDDRLAAVVDPRWPQRVTEMMVRGPWGAVSMGADLAR